ncbi:hypothetical protein G9C98_007300 [Cotesia typhae]|uniref:Uncharacterized protein n=1 Tax=Cotesia typhae TaxID=2053667 RepID=A0A8J5R8J4_9HYME|nr:hypothetical protein G9C98_007300 [Cotesia typhae]
MFKFLALFIVLMIASCEEADDFDELISIVESKLNIVNNGACVRFMGDCQNHEQCCSQWCHSNSRTSSRCIFPTK